MNDMLQAFLFDFLCLWIPGTDISGRPGSSGLCFLGTGPVKAWALMVICDYFVLLKNTPERGLERWLRESKFNSQHYVRQLTAACVSSPEDLFLLLASWRWYVWHPSHWDTHIHINKSNSKNKPETQKYSRKDGLMSDLDFAALWFGSKVLCVILLTRMILIQFALITIKLAEWSTWLCYPMFLWQRSLISMS